MPGGELNSGSRILECTCRIRCFTSPIGRGEISVEQIRRVIDHRAFDGEHFELGDDAAIGGKSAGLAAGGEHAVAGHHDRAGIAPERLADVTRQFDAAEPFGDIAVSERLAWRDGARDVVDAAVELGARVEIEHDIGEVVRLAGKQFDDPVDRALHLGRRRRFRDVAMALADTGTGLVLAAHRQLHPIDAPCAPHDAAAADRGIEYCKTVAGHGWLQILWLQSLSLQILSLNGSSLMLAPNLGLEIVAIHPDSGGTWRHQQMAIIYCARGAIQYARAMASVSRSAQPCPPRGNGHTPDFVEQLIKIPPLIRTEPSIQTLHVNGYDMAYLEVGNGPPLVCVHGSLCDFRIWSCVHAGGACFGFEDRDDSRRHASDVRTGAAKVLRDRAGVSGSLITSRCSTSRVQQGRRGRRPPGDAANVKDENSDTYDFDRHREQRDQKSR